MDYLHLFWVTSLHGAERGWCVRGWGAHWGQRCSCARHLASTKALSFAIYGHGGWMMDNEKSVLLFISAGCFCGWGQHWTQQLGLFFILERPAQSASDAGPIGPIADLIFQKYVHADKSRSPKFSLGADNKTCDIDCPSLTSASWFPGIFNTMAGADLP